MDDVTYREHILELFRSPHNFGRLERADGEHRGFNPLCGDDITMQVSLREGRIAAVRFSGAGCAISTAAASIITDRVNGMTRDQVMALGREDVLGMLRIPISPVRLKCALLPLETLQRAMHHVTGERHGDA